jgi:hypothetical protein
MDAEQITNMNINVLCDKCGKLMRLSKFCWINGQVCIDVEPCSCVYYEKMKKFDKELKEIIND